MPAAPEGAAGGLLEIAEQFAPGGLVDGGEQCDRLAIATHAAGAADAVREQIRRLRQLKVDHLRHVLDVEPAGGDVGGEQ